MNEKNKIVVSNIIAAVESGGQVYSETEKAWTAYEGKYANTTNEVTCTLGPYQAYGDEAQELIQYIYDNYPDVFKACDPKGLIKAKLSVSWVGTQWGPSPEQKACLVAMLGTDAGHEASEHVFRERLDKYISNAESFGVRNVDGQMMWVEVQHLGGKNAPVRVFTRANGDYSSGHIRDCLNPKYADLVTYREPVEHQKFWSRHVKCAEFISKYADLTDGGTEGKKGVTMGTTAEEIIKRARSYIGYREKNHSWANMEDFTADAGDGNFQMFQPLAGAGNGDQWCQYFVDAVAVEVTGSIKAAKELLCQTNSGNYMTGYTPEGSSFFKSAGRWFTVPEPGDVVYFYSSSMGRICHVGYVESVDKASKTITTIEGNTNRDGFATNGGCVARHEYSYKSIGIPNRVVGFGRPKYGTGMLSKGSTGESVVNLQKNLDKLGYFEVLQNAEGKWYEDRLIPDGDFGTKTEAQVLYFQRNEGLEYDGVAGPETLARIDERLAEMASKNPEYVAKEDISKAAAEIMSEARAKKWLYGDSHVYPPCLDYYISCDRLISLALYRCGVKNQPAGGWKGSALEKALLEMGWEKTTDREKVRDGAVVVMYKGGSFCHCYWATEYDIETGICTKYDAGDEWRWKDRAQPFVGVPANEWSDGRVVGAVYVPKVKETAPEAPKTPDRKELVRIGQKHTIDFTGHKIDMDGSRGKETTANMIRCLQKAANDDWNAGLVVDGIDGQKTKDAFKGHYIKLGEKQMMITAVEIICYCLGRDPKGVEKPGIFGDGLAKAVDARYLSGEDILALVS